MTTEVFSITADRPEQETLPLFAVARESDVKNVGMREQNLLSLSYGNIVRRDINSADGLLPASFETYQIVEPGMTILRFTDLQNDQRSLRSGLVTERGIITSAYVAVDPFAMDPRFFAYMMRAYDTNKVFYGMGGGVRQGLNFDSIRRLPVPNLPLDEQRAITDYLDQETAQIDALVAKQEEFIGLLRERRGAVQDRLLLSSDAPLVPLRHITEQITVGIVVQPAQWYVDEGILALRGTNIKPERIDLADLVYLSNEGHARHFKSHLRAGDVVVVRTGQSGTAAVVPPELSGSNAIDLLLVRPNRRLMGEYLAMVLNAPGMREISNQEIVGTIQGHLNVAALRGLNIPVPEISDQRTLVSEWRSASITIDALIAKAEEHIDLAKERRSALITAAVTGQFDVRTAKKGTRV
ncbi:hypothetical protein [Glutamicibacter arilaitensis]|uniref:hypothetical protein n=1 Tax=Glutamicibacter arilaitensis TaxID=256701 RepID=UPI003FB8C874